jgi:ketosteroid isomerase-like protein
MSSRQVVRKPVRVHERSRRTLDQRLNLRFPRLVAAQARLIGRLPPSSRLRQAAVWRGSRLAAEAFNRGDLDAYLLSFHPDCEWQPLPEFVEAGLAEPSYSGLAGWGEYWSAVSEVWGSDLRMELLELIDTGDRLVALANLHARGQASGVPLSRKYAQVVTLKDGLVIHQREYPDHAQALEAVGVREQ